MHILKQISITLGALFVTGAFFGLLVWVAIKQTDKEMKTAEEDYAKFEYDIEEFDCQQGGKEPYVVQELKILQEKGAQGWELVSVQYLRSFQNGSMSYIVYYFKRKKTDVSN